MVEKNSSNVEAFDKAEEKKPNRAQRRQAQKSSSKSKRKGKKSNSSDYKGARTNDPAWYSASPELLRDAASIPFSWPVGTPMRTSTVFNKDVVPGICALHLDTVIGTSLNSNAPINVAASAIYSWVRHANSGHANYDAPDLMMYYLAMSNVYSFVVWCQRLYGYVSMYDQKNRYMPKMLASADGVNFESIRDNLANFRYFLNVYINKVASLAVPNAMPIFRRLAMLYANVYIEGPSIKDQLYMFRPNALAWYKFQINSSTGAGELILTPMTVAGTYATFEEIKTYANDLFNAIWDQEDFGIMSGDTLKAYDGNIVTLSPVPEVMNMTPIYDALVLHQFKNAKICSEVDISKIAQSNGLITQSIMMGSTLSPQTQAIAFADAKRDKILSTDFDAPTPDVVIESTRLMYAYDEYAGVFQSGSELAVQVAYWTFNNSGAPAQHADTNANHFYDTSSGLNANDTSSLLNCVQLQSAFKYRPEKVYYGVSGNNVMNDKAFRSWDIDNYAILSNSDLIKMHETALMSLFAVPAIGKIS